VIANKPENAREKFFIVRSSKLMQIELHTVKHVVYQALSSEISYEIIGFFEKLHVYALFRMCKDSSEAG
jgi:hypothetical protein